MIHRPGWGGSGAGGRTLEDRCGECSVLFASWVDGGVNSEGENGKRMEG